MTRDPKALTSQSFDLLIIGGGILGAGIARDAVLRGLRVALVDKADFASGTSGRSSKLIHGGFRYLEQRNFRLVAEACRERRILQEIAPDRVKPLPFILPVYDGDPRSLLKLRLGMTLYDILALYRNTAPHRTLDVRATLDAEPALNPHGLRGSIRYYDCHEDDARFCVDNILHAAQLGATCVNYCEVTDFARKNGRIEKVRLTDRLRGESFEASARVIVNAAGPWVERVAALSPGDGARVELGPTKGVHLLVSRMNGDNAICFQARRDGRIMFLLPWQDCSLLGTTDTEFKGDPAAARADSADVAYLLTELGRLIPTRAIDSSSIITSFAGVRPLLRSDLRTPSSRSREERIARGGENLLTVAGGKYTTYRAIAEKAVDAVFRMTGRRPPACRTARTPLPGSVAEENGEKLSDVPVVFTGDVERACRNEMAQSVADVMYRRTGLALSRFGGPTVAARVAQVMAECLSWSASQREQSLNDYLREREYGLL